jgi:pseudaminic acid biosynthesis-associated methylase
MNDQQTFWKEEYSTSYINKNSQFDHELGVKGWRSMLKSATGINSILECGSNIGRNIGFLDEILPGAKKSIIEISPTAYKLVTSRYQLASSFNGSILDSSKHSAFTDAKFDFVFTCGVLIHIHPDDLLANMNVIFDHSGKYVLLGEYFNRTQVMLEYQGQLNKLFKSDFGKLFVNNFKVKLVDYGFLWGHIYDAGGFDDITWWLFEK